MSLILTPAGALKSENIMSPVLVTKLPSNGIEYIIASSRIIEDYSYKHRKNSLLDSRRLKIKNRVF